MNRYNLRKGNLIGICYRKAVLTLSKMLGKMARENPENAANRGDPSLVRRLCRKMSAGWIASWL